MITDEGVRNQPDEREAVAGRGTQPKPYLRRREPQMDTDEPSAFCAPVADSAIVAAATFRLDWAGGLVALPPAQMAPLVVN